MQQIDSGNTIFTLATDLVNHTSRHLFLTGKAGTGKTTFLKYIRENCPKQMAVVAPTGVAAINANGVTIHSFFQLPFAPFVPASAGFRDTGTESTSPHTLLSRLRFNEERRKVIRELELLIIDEISMVRCDVLDAIDLVLRHVRNRHLERFGGVQVLFIGDMFQLPPVVKEQEWNILKEYYSSPYFFDSLVVKEDPPVYVEFTKIYRQTEENFIRLLNQVRNNELDKEGLEQLHKRYQPSFFDERPSGYILLTTHNEKAKNINASELQKLESRAFTYKAMVEDDFPSAAYPADEFLQLKVGAQVMFIKNDTEKTRRYFNGKIGVVTELTGEKITVQCKDDPSAIEVKKEKWENIRYTLNTSNRHLEEDVLGSFSQYPLRLAWAITIHKSQGLTFEKAVIDASEAFAPGQVYVALSRCTTLDGIVLHNKIRPHSFKTDERIVRFSKSNLHPEELQKELAEAKKNHHQKILVSLFGLEKPVDEVKRLQAFLSEHGSSFNAEVFPWIEKLTNALMELQNVAGKFQSQLKSLFPLSETIEKNVVLHERIRMAVTYFSKEFKKQTDFLLQSPAITDSTMQAKEYNELARELFTLLSFQKFMLSCLDEKFTLEVFHRHKRNFVVPSFTVNSYAGASEKKVELAHPVLYFQLKKLRDSICSKKNVPIYIVAGSKTLEEMATYLPLTMEELEEISGFGKAKVETYGKLFLPVVQEYCEQNDLGSNMSDKIPKRKRKEPKAIKQDTKAETLRLYKEGKSATEIAVARNLTVQTIETHLAHYVQSGQLKIEELVSREKLVLIEPAAKELAGGSIAGVKEKLGTQASFGEIRLVMAWLEYQKSISVP
jgi:DNA-binding CsgD family transcriptional regulator